MWDSQGDLCFLFVGVMRADDAHRFQVQLSLSPPLPHLGVPHDVGSYGAALQIPDMNFSRSLEHNSNAAQWT